MAEERTAPEGAGPDSDNSVWTWAVPALAFVAGVVLGGVVVAAGASDDDDAGLSAAATAVPSAAASERASPRPSGDVVVRVPAACLNAIDKAEEAARRIDDVVAAVRALDAERLQELVDGFQQLQPDLERVSRACGETTGNRLSEGELVAPAPAPSR